MSSPSTPDWLAQLIAEEGESKPVNVQERNALLCALTAAESPSDIAAERHRQILAQALESVEAFAPPTEQELLQAAQLRAHFDSNPLVLALRATQDPSPPRPQLERALRQQALQHVTHSHRARSLRRISTLWGAVAVAAAAAIVVLAKSNSPLEKFEASPSSRPLALSRSTDSLFTRSFDSTSASGRIDKIAQVRARDLRRNRYAIWGLP